MINKFDYTKLEQITLEDGSRYYLDPLGNKLHSVTTILSATSNSKQRLQEWRDRVGNEKAEQVRSEAVNIGKLMHTHLECYIADIERPQGQNLIRKLSRDMADVIIKNALEYVDEYYGIEIPLYFPGKYAGTADLIAVHRGALAVCDYKTTKKMKTSAEIEDYFCQTIAYSLAHNEIYGTDINKCSIFMVSRDLEYKEFVVEGQTFEKYKNVWLSRLDGFLNSLN